METVYNSLLPLIEIKGIVKDPQTFHERVNLIFHDHEAKSYDFIHDEMWKSLPYQFELFINDGSEWLAGKQKLRLLDIGCGTGLATQILLNTSLGNAIDNIHLLDTSSAMLQKAKKRAAKWMQSSELLNGDISILREEYDVIIISSVLHHIPNLSLFLQQVQQHQKSGGVLFTIHDPYAGAISSSMYTNRCEEYRQHCRRKGSMKKALPVRALNRFKRLFNRENYIDKINEALLTQQVIKYPLTEHELWSITDIHVEGLPYSANDGIDINILISGLNKYSLLSLRTYSFYGLMASELDAAYQQKERELSMKRDMYGRNFGSIWVKQI